MENILFNKHQGLTSVINVLLTLNTWEYKLYLEPLFIIHTYYILSFINYKINLFV